jgi:hypothetical protein
MFIDHVTRLFIFGQRVVELLKAHTHLLCPLEEVVLQLLVQLLFWLFTVIHRLACLSYVVKVAFRILVRKDGLNFRDLQKLFQVSPCSLGIKLLSFRESIVSEDFAHGRSD